MAGHPRIVLDCRWLSSGGAGRVTELLLRGLATGERRAEWVLWGPPAARALAWPGAELVVQPEDPRRWNGQRHLLSVPPGDLVVFMHQQRPLRPVPSVSMIHDTISLRSAGGRADRAIKRLFLTGVARASRQVVTPSEHSRRSILADLGVGADRVTVLGLPGDPELAGRVAGLRRRLDPEPVALYLGLFLPHKNLSRLIEAFGRTGFREGGGRLVLMGGTSDQRAALESGLTTEQREYVEARPFGGDAELERLLATCRLLVQPSLEEGFGLPAWEALCCGVPVSASTGGSLPEVTRGRAVEFPPESVDRMAAALDACAAAAAGRGPEAAEANSRSFLAQAPTIADYALRMQEVALAALRT